jgi:hypothetical protein
LEHNQLKQLQFEDPDFDPNFNLVLDIRNIEDIVSEESIKSYTVDIKPLQVFTKRIKAAVITHLPSQVTGATLYKLFENKAIDCEVFSTLEYALKWLGVGIIDLENMDFNKTQPNK